MTKTQEYLSALPPQIQELFGPLFGSIKCFYVVTYLVARNEHITELEKPEQYEIRLNIIRQIRRKIEQVVDGFGLEGSDLVADIASDYFEDYVGYKEAEIQITNEEFISIINKISVL